MSELATDLPLDLFQTAPYPEFLLAKGSEKSLTYEGVWIEACADLILCDSFRHQPSILEGLDFHEDYGSNFILEP